MNTRLDQSRRTWSAMLDPRDERGRGTIAQIVVGIVVVLILARFALGVAADFQEQGLTPGFGFLENTAGFGISESRSFTETDSYWQAFRVGLENTLRVAVLGIVLATPLGALIAFGRLSGNPLASRISAAYVEIFRNTPLLVQLIFWYQGVLLRLPGLSDAIRWGPGQARGAAGGGIGDGAAESGVPEGVATAWLALSQKGVAMPRLVLGPGSAAFAGIILGGAVVAVLVFTWRRQRSALTGERPHGFTLAGVTWAVTIAFAWLVFGRDALAIELPTVERFRYAGGIVLSPEYSALLFGLVTYTAAFVAEVVRGGIQSVQSGQFEAGRAVGLSEGQLMRHVVMPQALRVIVPPLTNQYLNLTKNSSLAIYIGFPDLFNVSLTIGNQTGQFVIVTSMIMAVYLSLSLLASLAMNLYSRKIQLVER